MAITWIKHAIDGTNIHEYNIIEQNLLGRNFIFMREGDETVSVTIQSVDKTGKHSLFHNLTDGKFSVRLDVLDENVKILCPQYTEAK